MKLFTISNNNVQVTPEVLTINEFKKIYDNDKTKTKHESCAIYSYIYHLVDAKSSYINYSNREEQCKKDFIPKIDINQDILDAIEKYRELITTPEERLLTACFKACDQLANYLGNVNFNDRDEKGNLVHDPHKMVTSLKQVKNVIKELKELRAMTEKGQDEQEALRGGQELNMFEQKLR